MYYKQNTQACRGYEISHPYPQIFSWISMGISMDISMDLPMDISMDLPMDYLQPVYGLHVKLPLRFHKAQHGVGRHIKTTMTQAFLSEIIVIKMHRSK